MPRNFKSRSPLGPILESRIEPATTPKNPHTAQTQTPRRPRHDHPKRGAPSTGGNYQFQKFGGKRRPDRPRRDAHPPAHQPSRGPLKTTNIPPLAPGAIRIVPLGGVEEIGKNMTAIEIGDDIIVVDAGMQFANEDTPGIDYIIPNTTYLEERKGKIRAMVVTHGHLDHIGGIPLVMDRIGNPPIYSRNLTILLMKKRQSEFPHLKPLDAHIVEKDSVITAGNMRIKFFGVTHTVPDSMGIIVETPYGMIVTPGDYKLEQSNGLVSEREEKEYKVFDNQEVLLLMTDSTNIENPGWSTPEKEVHKGLETIIRSVKGRLVVAAFASHIERLMKIIEVAEVLNKKVVLEGRSIKTNIEVAIQADLIHPKKGTIISMEEAEAVPKDRVIILSTGAQGEEFSALMRASNKTHKAFRLETGDTIVLSASIVPGNEMSVQRLKDNLARHGVKIIHYRTSEVYVHSTGHGNVEEIKWLHRKTHPKFFIPIHGHHYMLQLHKELAHDMGMPNENIIVPDNGSIIEIRERGTKITMLKEKAPSSPMMVDGFSIGDEQDVVIRDRQMLAQDGMFVIVATIDQATGKLKKSPDIISRGFVYLKESQDLLHQSRMIIKKTVEEGAAGQNPINFDYLKNALAENLSKFLIQKTAKRPLVIPVLVGV